MRREIKASEDLLTARMDGRNKLSDALFKASEDAATKSENRFDRQLGQLQDFINAKVDGLESKINDLRDRLQTDEGRSSGIGKSANVLYLVVGLVVAIVAVVITFYRSGAN